jgi:transposase
MDQTATETAKRWSEIVGRWRRSGMTGRVFTEQEGINVSTLFGWSRKLRPSTDTLTATGTSMLLPVTILEPSAPAPGPIRMLEVLMPGGEIVRVPPGVAKEQLASVVRALRGGES